jgi:hypothetical protein
VGCYAACVGNCLLKAEAAYWSCLQGSGRLLHTFVNDTPRRTRLNTLNVQCYYVRRAEWMKSTDIFTQWIDNLEFVGMFQK